ncbi:MAG TPA: hypothetical protein VM598_01920 [Bdellovibrionota bacterium]|nr:hypothetical protein [Bdellovibrionota bacterium]
MSYESAKLGPLEKSKSRFELYDRSLTAIEFSVASLALNQMILGSVLSGGATGAALKTGAQAVSIANSQATIRQAINATIGTVSIVWAASYQSGYGELRPDSVGAHDIERSAAHEQVSQGFRADRAYAAAGKHVEGMIGYYAKLDNDIRLNEARHHEQHLIMNSPRFAASPPECRMLLMAPSACSADYNWRLLRMILPGTNYFAQRAQSETIGLSAVQTHLKLYMEELRFLTELHGKLFAHCELKNEAVAKGGATPESVWSGVLEYAKQIKQLPTGEAAPALSGVQAAAGR